MKLRLYHHGDGARIAYRERGTGPGLALLHSALLSHREWEPAVEWLAHRFRVVLPDLPLHGDSEDRPRHPYTLRWTEEVLAGFLHDTCGPRPLVAGHDLGALLALHATAEGRLRPARLVVASCALHRRSARHTLDRRVALAMRAGGAPGLDRLLSRAATVAFRPSRADALSHAPGARDLLRHAFMDVGGNANRARAWARAARDGWVARPAWTELHDAYERVTCPVLLLWADRDPWCPVAFAEEALELLPDAQLRVVPGAGFLMAYDDPVGVAREIAAFCG